DAFLHGDAHAGVRHAVIHDAAICGAAVHGAIPGGVFRRHLGDVRGGGVALLQALGGHGDVVVLGQAAFDLVAVVVGIVLAQNHGALFQGALVVLGPDIAAVVVVGNVEGGQPQALGQVAQAHVRLDVHVLAQNQPIQAGEGHVEVVLGALLAA